MYFLHILCVMYHQQLCNQIRIFSHNVETNNKGILLFGIISEITYNMVSKCFFPKTRHMNLTDLSVIYCTIYTWFDRDCLKLIQMQIIDFLCG